MTDVDRVQHFFHGTNADLAVGDQIRPSSVTGVTQAHPSTAGHRPAEYDASKWAHATSSEHTAWAFAERAAHFNHRGMGLNRGPAPNGDARARVYRVEPVGKSQIGVENRDHPQYTGHDNQEHIAAGWRVTGREDIAPPPDRTYVSVPKAGGKGTKRAYIPNVWGQQGTLPVDWTQHGADHPATGNHPQVGHGTDAQDHVNATQFAPPAEPAREEVAGQQAMFPVPRSTGARKLKAVRAGKA